MTRLIEQASTSVLVDTSDGVTLGARRRWPDELKRRMVEECRAPGASVSVVARRYDVNANQLFRWRRQYEASLGDHALAPAGVRLVPVSVGPAATAGLGRIEIDLQSGARVRAIGAVEAGLLGHVLAALR